MKKLFVLASLLLITITGCVNITQPPAAQPATPPVVVTFSVNPTEIKTGESATLLWNVTGATSVTIDQGISNVNVADTKTVSPAKTTTYTLTATNSAGTKTESVTLTVGGFSTLPGLINPHILPITLTETVLDFINEAPSASWRDSKGTVTCAPGQRVDIFYDHLFFGDGVKYPKMLVFYCSQYPDFIEGTYPEITIPTGAHFVAKVSYAKGVQTNVGVDFCVSFTETSTAFVTTLVCKNVTPDQNFYAFDIDLSSIVDKTGRVSLRASTAPGSYPELYAQWLDTKIIH